MGKGRPRKQGKRTPNGRISEAGKSRRDLGTDWVQARKARFGIYHNSALGRAFASGLLGEGVEAKDRLAAAEKLSASLQRHVRAMTPRYRCALNTEPRGRLLLADDYEALEAERRDWKWFNDATKKIDAVGGRPFLDQLIHDHYADYGPYWLDRLLDGGKHPADLAVLQAALKAIDAIVPARVARIVVVRK